MKALRLTALFLLSSFPLLRAADAASVWATLDIQVGVMTQAVASKNVAALIELEHVVADEVSGLRRDPGLSPDAAPFLNDIAKWSAATSHAAKDNDWKSANDDQVNFAQAVKQAEAAATPGKKKD